MGHGKIVAAAIRTEDGRVVSLPAPARHVAVELHMAVSGYSDQEIHFAEKGFVTEDGTWARRQPALRIAHKYEQLLPGAPANPRHGLSSEDVW